MHIKEQDKDQAIFIKYSSWQSEEKTHIYGPHQNPIDFAWINPTNSFVLELWKSNSCLFKKSRKMKKIFENRKKFVQVHAKIRMTTNLLKSGFLVT